MGGRGAGEPAERDKAPVDASVVDPRYGVLGRR